MLTAKILCQRVEEAQACYADLLARFDRMLALDPNLDHKEIDRLNGEIADLSSKADELMTPLLPELGEWRSRRADYPDEANLFITTFITLLQSGLSEALEQVERRTQSVGGRRDKIREVLRVMTKQRKALSGYKVTAKAVPQVINSKA
jgi:hypothetical protein